MGYEKRWNYGPAIIDEMGRIRIANSEGNYELFDRYFPTGSDRSLYLEFSSLDPDHIDQIKAFVNRYGVLGLESDADAPDINLGYWPLWNWLKLVNYGTKEYDPLDRFQHEIVTMQLVLETWSELRRSPMDIESMRENIRRLSWLNLPIGFWKEFLLWRDDGKSSDKLPMLDAWRKFCDAKLRGRPDMWGNEFATYKADEVALMVSDVISTTIEARLASQTSISLYRTGEWFSMKTSPRTLLAAMYLMLATDLTGAMPARRCQNEKCGHFFLPSRQAQVYCCPACQTQQRIRRYRRRHKDSSHEEP